MRGPRAELDVHITNADCVGALHSLTVGFLLPEPLLLTCIFKNGTDLPFLRFIWDRGRRFFLGVGAFSESNGLCQVDKWIFRLCRLSPRT